MIDAAAFAKMKPGTIFVSTARGGIHDEAALAEALASRHLARCGARRLGRRAAPAGSSAAGLDNVVATYHTSGVTPEARARMGSFAADQMVGILSGNLPPRLLNPEALPRFRERFQALMGFPFNG